MENPLEQYEIDLIEKNLMRKTYADIAFLLDRPVQEVYVFITEHIKGRDLVSHQQSIDAKKAARIPAAKKPRAPRPRVKKKKENVIISRMIVQDQKVARARRNDPRFKTKEVDYTKLKTVRIDDKTFVYAEVHEDPEVVRKKYFSNLKLPKNIAPSQRNSSVEVKKFKPI